LCTLSLCLHSSFPSIRTKQKIKNFVQK
jgi:hypothetical protein